MLTTQTLDGVRAALNGFLVAESGGALVGVAGLEVCCEHALLRSVAVVPAWRSKGLGRELVTRDEVPADVQTTGEFQGACPDSATVMRRPLSSTSRPTS